MPRDEDDLGDARSRLENSRFREMGNRRKAENPEYAYAPRWVPTGNWHASLFDVVMAVLGAAILAVAAVVTLFF